MKNLPSSSIYRFSTSAVSCSSKQWQQAAAASSGSKQRQKRAAVCSKQQRQQQGIQLTTEKPCFSFLLPCPSCMLLWSGLGPIIKTCASRIKAPGWPLTPTSHPWPEHPSHLQAFKQGTHKEHTPLLHIHHCTPTTAHPPSRQPMQWPCQVAGCWLTCLLPPAGPTGQGRLHHLIQNTARHSMAQHRTR